MSDKMFEQIIETSASPHITVTEARKNLKVQGTKTQQVVIHVDGEAEDLNLEQEGETLTISAQEDCKITCPAGSTLTLQTVYGNVKVADISGTLALDTIKGNLSLQDVGPTELGEVSGNLNARDVAGSLQGSTVTGNAKVYDVEGGLRLDQVNGNLRAHDIDGDLQSTSVNGNAQASDVKGQCTIERVGGNFTATDVEGSVMAEQIGGNGRLAPDLAPGATYRVSAGGNLTIHLPEDASASLSLRAGGGVRSRIADLELEAANGEMKGTLGAGEATLEAQAGGTINLKGAAPAGFGAPGDFAFDMGFMENLEQIGPMVEARVNEAMAEMEIRLDQGLGNLDSEKIRLKIERVAEKSARAAERAAEQVRRTAEREAQKAHMRAERAQRRWDRASGKKVQPRPEPASQEEQLRILRMVEEGKITPEQAADLLAAMSGR